MLRSLRLPEGVASVSVFDQSFGKDGVIRDVEDHIAREIMAHDPRITEFVSGGEGDPDQMPGGDSPRKTALLMSIPKMNRRELFAMGATLHISTPANLKSDALAEILTRHVIAADEEDLPMVVGASGDAAGGTDGPLMMTPEVAASANRGNDSLGSNRGVHTSGGGGSTFKQAEPPFADPAARPAPSGLGQVAATGTAQPPYNQLGTETGVPSHDADLAPFPINVPPIDPATGKPFEAGDPRIPLTARPALREAPADVVVSDGAVLAVYDAADRINDAAGGARSLETDSERAVRDASAKAAAEIAAKSAPGTDANHGNDAEGQKSKTALKN